MNTITKLAIIMSTLIVGTSAAGHGLETREALPYVLEKLGAHQLVLMGTIHRKPQILALTAKLLPRIKAAGVTHLALEVPSDQQYHIDRFLKNGSGLADIRLHRSIDCPQYRRLFSILGAQPPNERPKVVAVDLPPAYYSGPTGRDEYMAMALADLLQAHTDVKILAMLGSLHVLKELDWQPRIIDRQQSIRSLLQQWRPGLKVFSLVHLLAGGDTISDFSARLGPMPGINAVDLDDRFSGWRLGVTDCLAVRYREAYELVDGVIVH